MEQEIVEIRESARCHICGHKPDLYMIDKKNGTWSAGCPICMMYVSGIGPENALRTWMEFNELHPVSMSWSDRIKSWFKKRRAYG